MKNLLNIFGVVFFVTVFGSCTSDKNNSEMDEASDYISGKVQEIQPGKDGYTAKIITDDNQVYFATISIPNLDNNAHQYRAVEVGETITIQGDVWKMDDETYVTVRELK